jgi:hypothetical protein
MGWNAGGQVESIAIRRIPNWRKIIETNGKFSPKNLGELAIKYQLPVTAMSEILEERGCLPTGTWERLKDRGCTARSIGVVWD